MFTQKFYKDFFDAVVEAGKADYCYGDVCEGKSIPIDFYVGDLYVTCEAHYVTELHDESFDHLFGTWHDPRPYFDVVGVDGITDVKIYESNDKDSPEVSGFDLAAVWAQAEADTSL